MDKLCGMVYSLDRKLTPNLSPSAATSVNTPSPPTISSQTGLQPNIGASQMFSGNPEHLGGFLLQCNLAFNRAPVSFTSDSAQLTYLISALQGDALRWTHAYFQDQHVNKYSFSVFLNDFQKVFEVPLHHKTASKRLMALRQGTQTVAEFSVHLGIVAQEARWDDCAVRGIFSNALNDHIQDQLSTRDEPDNLNDLINLAIRIDDRLHEQKNQKNYKSHNSTSA